jgi:hypothetical protein
MRNGEAMMGQRSGTGDARSLQRRARRILLAAVVVACCGSAEAVELDTGLENVSLRWDNTLRYNAGWRLQHRDSRIGDNPASDESDYKFGQGQMVTNRLDVLSELDFVYKERYGFRLSGNLFYDYAYRHADAVTNPDLGVPSSYEGARYSGYTARWYRAGGELLDAFVFANLELGKIPLNVKVGQHTVYWGQSLFYAGGISYSQSPIDAAKGLANPGTEIKELFLPLTQISFQSQILPELSLVGQYYLDWKPYRVPEGGTYLGAVDFALTGPNGYAFPSSVPGASLFHREHTVEPENQYGNWGIGAKWTPGFMDGGSFGFYYRKFDEKLPWLFADPKVAFPFAYRTVYPRRTELYGISMEHQLGPLAVAGEVSYRRNTALLTPSFAFLQEGGGARGNTVHVVANTIYLVPETPLWVTGVLLAEVHYSYLHRVTTNEAVFQGEDRAACVNPLTLVPGSGNKWDGCATKNAAGATVSFTPQWPQALPGVDLSLPLVADYQFFGNEAVLGGSNQGSFSYSAGIEADLRQRLKIRVAYNGYGARITREAGGVWASINGSNALLRDRGWLSLTIKGSF